MMTYGYMSDDGQRFGVMSEVAEHGGMSVVHAEDDAIASFLTQKYIREGKTHGAYICEVRGPIVEEAGIRRAMFLAERAGSPRDILHMAAASGIDALTEARCGTSHRSRSTAGPTTRAGS
jgi:dihydroorotase-like cyclic amidohydrolase